VDKAREAVEATSGLVLTYEGTLIEATYFSCSGGITEDAVAVWGTDFPYLRSVESPGEESAAHYTDTVRYTKSELEEKLGIPLTGDPKSWFSSFQYTAGGGVDTVKVGGILCAGTFLRSKLSLRSTAFTLSADDDGITITTRGFGHRVGMSQYGADVMAVNGSTFEEILAHYYPGATLELTNDRG
jgi:stage II sporulation protein D